MDSRSPGYKKQSEGGDCHDVGLVRPDVPGVPGSRHAEELLRTGLVSPQEEPEVARVLNAAALTYVAATLSSVLTLLYFLFRAGILGGSSRDD
jgi:hypothetical protein